MSVISSYPQIPTTRNALTPRDVASYVTNQAYANDAALDAALTALTATVATLPTVAITATIPSAATIGYFWVDTGNNNQLKICNTTYGAGASDKPSKWTSIRDVTTLSTATSAQSAANTPSATTSSAFPSAYTQGWIWVNSTTGAAYICKETYTATLPEGDRPSKFTAMVDSSTTATLVSIQAAVADIGDDEKITPDEKLALQREWAQIQDKQGLAVTQATNWSLTGTTPYTNLVSAYNNLDTYLNTTLDVFDDLTATTDLVAKSSTRTQWNSKWSSWYLANSTFTDSAANTVRSSVVDMGDDEKITPDEKSTLQREWTQIGNIKSGMDTHATNWSLTGNSDYVAAVTAYNNLDTYLNTTLDLFDDPTTTTNLVTQGSSRATWNTKWSAWYSAYATFNVSASASVKSTVDDMANDDKIVPGEKLVLKREWTQIQNNKTAMDGLASDIALTENANYTAAVAAYNALDTYLNTTLTVFASMTTTTVLSSAGSNRTTWNTKWTNWYEAIAAFSRAASAALKTEINRNQSDEVITEAEARSYRIRWDYEIQNYVQHEACVTALEASGLTVKSSNATWLAYKAAYETLYAYLNSTLDFFGFSSWPMVLVDEGSSASEWRTKWNAYSTAERAMSILGSTTTADAINTYANDGSVDQQEKRGVKSAWRAIYGTTANGEYATLIARAATLIADGNTDLITPRNNLVSAYDALYTYLFTTLSGNSGIFNMNTDTTVDNATWDSTWGAYYNAYNALDTAASAIADTGVGLVSGLVTEVGAIQSDETITESEARDIKVTWDYETRNHSNHESIVDALAEGGIITKSTNPTWTTYDSAYDTLYTYLNAVVNVFNNSTWPITLSDVGTSAAQWRTKWDTYYQAERAMSILGNTSILAQLDSYANDGSITAQEKRGVIQAWNIIYGTTGTDGEYALLISRANALISAGNSELTAKRDTLSAAYSALNTYLGTLSNIFDPAGADTTVDNYTWDTKWKAYYLSYADLDAATSAIADVATAVSAGLIDEGVITAGKEKQQLIDILTNITTEYSYMLTKATVGVGASTTSYTAKYTALRDYLWNLFGGESEFNKISVGVSGISRAVWLQKFNEYYEAREALENAILTNNIANLSRDSASLPNMATDGEITSEEKYVAKQYWTIIFGDDASPNDNGEHAALKAQATTLGVSSTYTTPFDTAFTLLWNFLTDDSHGSPQCSSDSLGLFTDMGTSKTLTSAQQAEWQTAWSDYYSTRDVVSLQITAALQTNLDGKFNKDGSIAMTGTLNMGNHQVSNLLAATASGQAVDYDQYSTHIATVPFARNTSNQFGAMTAKSTLAAADLFVIEDSAAAAAKKKTTVSDVRVAVGSPAGAITAFAGSSAPSGWLMCDGATVSQTTYAALYAVVGHTYGADPGGGNFILPNLQNRVPVCKGSGTFASLAATGGAETHTLSTAQLASHTHLVAGNTASDGDHGHTVTDPGHTHATTSVNTTGGAIGGATPGTGFDNGAATSGSSTTGITVASGSAPHVHYLNITSFSAGSGDPHNNLQPYIVLNYIIKT